MADVALVAGASEATPLDYVVPGAQEIIPKAATASYDGSGAAGSFVPTLIIRAPNGAILAACPVADPLAAGASADVSWFPRGGVAKTTPPVTTGPLYFAGMNSTGGVIVSAGDYITIQQIPFNPDEVYPNYASNDGSTFDTPGTYYSRNPGLGINILQPGVYLVLGSASEAAGPGVQLRTSCSSVSGGNNGDPLLTGYDGGLMPGTAIAGDGSTWFDTSNLQAKGLYYLDESALPSWVGLTTVLPIGLNWDVGDHAVFVVRLGDIGIFPPNGFD